MLITAALVTCLAKASPIQIPGETLLGAVILRAVDGKPSAELFPIAIYANGKYKSAESSEYGDPPKVCGLKAGTQFYLYRNAIAVGQMKVSKVVTHDSPTGSYRLGQGDWQVDRAMQPQKVDDFIPGEEALSASMYFDVDEKGYNAPSRVLMAVNRKRSSSRGLLPFTTGEQAKVESAMRAHVDAVALKNKISTAHLKSVAFAAFDTDGDGKKEYAVLYKDVESDLSNIGIFVIGNLSNSKFVTLYDEVDHEIYPVPFDALDIDGDGRPEIICEAGAFEGCGFLVLSRKGKQFKKVFQEIEFGV